MTDKKYPSDLTDEEWEVVKMILLKEEGRSMGRPREVDLRRVWDAISYINKTGCQWGYLPHDFPPPTTVSYHYQKRVKSGLFERINREIRRMPAKKRSERRTQRRDHRQSKREGNRGIRRRIGIRWR